MTPNEYIEKVKAAGDLWTLNDGFCYYRPSCDGVLSAIELRAIADHLDKANEQWSREVAEMLANKEVELEVEE